VSNDYGANPIVWGINRSIRRVTGRTYEQLYRGWVRHLHRHYARQAQAVRRRGLRAGQRLTWHGMRAAMPRFVPSCARVGPHEQLLYYRSDGHSPGGLYRLQLAGRSARQSWWPEPRETRRRLTASVASFSRACCHLAAGTTSAT
jgi:hypothetical protein